jgi:hypothetical protein
LDRAGRPAQNALVSETRIKPVDGQARIRIRALWLVVGRFERLIDGEALALPPSGQRGPERGDQPR